MELGAWLDLMGIGRLKSLETRCAMTSDNWDWPICFWTAAGCIPKNMLNVSVFSKCDLKWWAIFDSVMRTEMCFVFLRHILRLKTKHNVAIRVHHTCQYNFSNAFVVSQSQLYFWWTRLVDCTMRVARLRVLCNSCFLFALTILYVHTLLIHFSFITLAKILPTILNNFCKYGNIRLHAQ